MLNFLNGLLAGIRHGRIALLPLAKRSLILITGLLLASMSIYFNAPALAGAAILAAALVGAVFFVQAWIRLIRSVMRSEAAS